MHAYNDATKEAYSYIRADLSPDTPENIRITTNITPEESIANFIISPIIYKPNVKKSEKLLRKAKVHSIR